MISAELLKILCCPETHQKLVIVDQSRVKSINQKISTGNLVNHGGVRISEPIEGGLVREDQKVVYPIRRGIPILLVDEAIPL